MERRRALRVSDTGRRHQPAREGGRARPEKPDDGDSMLPRNMQLLRTPAEALCQRNGLRPVTSAVARCITAGQSRASRVRGH